MQVKRICAYCGKYLGSKEVERKADRKLDITHGICLECFEKAMKDLEEIPPKDLEIKSKTKGDLP